MLDSDAVAKHCQAWLAKIKMLRFAQRVMITENRCDVVLASELFPFQSSFTAKPWSIGLYVAHNPPIVSTHAH